MPDDIADFMRLLRDGFDLEPHALMPLLLLRRSFVKNGPPFLSLLEDGE